MPKIRWEGDASSVAKAQETMTKGVRGFKGEIKETVKEAKTLDAAARRIAENANPQEKYNRKMADLKRLVDSGRVSLKAAEIEAKKYGDALDRAGGGSKKAFSVEGLAQITRTGMAVMGITDALSLAVQGFKEFDEARRKAAEESMRSRQGVGQLAQLAASAKDKDGNATPEAREAKYKALLKEADSYLEMGAAADRNEAAGLTFDLAAADLNKRDRKFAARLRASGTLTDVGGLAQAYDAMRTAMGKEEVGTFEQFTSKSLAAGAAAPGTVQQLPVALSKAGSSAKALGLSDEFIISTGAILAKEAGSPEQGATKLAALLTGIQKSGKEKELKGLTGAQMIEKLSTLPEKDLGYGGIFNDNAEAIAAFRTARSGIGDIKKLEADVFLAQSQGLGPFVSDIGAAAGVVVSQRERRGKDGKPETVRKFASAHDLRRSFGFRWSRLVMPPVLKELMRHSKVDTTMKYYVGLNAEATADELWRVAGNTLGNTAPNEGRMKRPCSPK